VSLNVRRYDFSGINLLEIDHQLLFQLKELDISYTGMEEDFIEYIKINGAKLNLNRLAISSSEEHIMKLINETDFSILIPTIKEVIFE
jgi:hypothetical protein